MQGFRLLLFQSCCTRNGIVPDAYLERSPVIRMHKTLGLVYTKSNLLKSKEKQKKKCALLI